MSSSHHAGGSDLPLPGLFARSKRKGENKYRLLCLSVPVLMLLIWNVPMAFLWLPSTSDTLLAPVDMHSHTTESDGDLTPREIMQVAKKNGIATLWITDHDMIRDLPGIRSILTDAADLQLEVHFGVEMTVDWLKKEHHLLGYFPDEAWSSSSLSPAMSTLQEECARVKASRINRNLNMVNWLNEILKDDKKGQYYFTDEDSFNNYRDISVEEVATWARDHADLSDSSSLGRPHFNKFLKTRGVRAELIFGPRGGEGAAVLTPEGEVLWDEEGKGAEGVQLEALMHSATLAKREIAFEPSPITEAIRLINAAGGRAVVAHLPTLGTSWPEKFGPKLEGLKAAGLWGVEAFSSEISEADHQRIHDFASLFGLVETGGSDNHGTLKRYAQLGKVFRATEDGYSALTSWASAAEGRSEEVNTPRRDV